MEFTHFDEQGNALMVDVGDKADTKREAVAKGSIFMSSECLKKVSEGTMAKGDVLGVARVAGIMGAKRTSDLIPLCHILNLTKLSIDFTVIKEKNEIQAACTARTTGRTGSSDRRPIWAALGGGDQGRTDRCPEFSRIAYFTSLMPE